MTTKYRISWTLFETGGDGHSEYMFPTYEVAQRAVDILNNSTDGATINHYVEAIEVEKKQCPAD